MIGSGAAVGFGGGPPVVVEQERRPSVAVPVERSDEWVEASALFVPGRQSIR
jgi:hypothetical protein